MDQQMEKKSLIAIATVCFGNLERSRQSGKTRRRRGEQENGQKKPNMTLQKIPQLWSRFFCFLKRKKKPGLPQKFGCRFKR
jgi:hypothetical protein